MSAQSLAGVIQGPPPPPPRGGWGDGDGGRGEYRRISLTGIVVALASVGMVFVAFTIVFATVRAESQDWIILPKPPILLLNTAVLLMSSVLLDRSRVALRNRNRTQFNVWWTAAAALGVMFLAGQWAAWQYLRGLGLHIDTIPSSSFFYMLTAAHAIHLAAGLSALVYVDVQAWRLRLGPAKRTLIDVTAVFWHFLTVVWLYLMALFYIWG